MLCVAGEPKTYQPDYELSIMSSLISSESSPVTNKYTHGSRSFQFTKESK